MAIQNNNLRRGDQERTTVPIVSLSMMMIKINYLILKAQSCHQLIISKTIILTVIKKNFFLNKVLNNTKENLTTLHKV